MDGRRSLVQVVVGGARPQGPEKHGDGRTVVSVILIDIMSTPAVSAYVIIQSGCAGRQYQPTKGGG